MKRFFCEEGSGAGTIDRVSFKKQAPLMASGGQNPPYLYTRPEKASGDREGIAVSGDFSTTFSTGNGRKKASRGSSLAPIGGKSFDRIMITDAILIMQTRVLDHKIRFYDQTRPLSSFRDLFFLTPSPDGLWKTLWKTKGRPLFSRVTPLSRSRDRAPSSDFTPEEDERFRAMTPRTLVGASPPRCLPFDIHATSLRALAPTRRDTSSSCIRCHNASTPRSCAQPPA